MYTKPALSVVELAVEHNSCGCGPSFGGKLNPANAGCGGVFMASPSPAPTPQLA